MQFSIAIIVAAAASVMADLHKDLYCIDRAAGDQFGTLTDTENNDATRLACIAYKNRHTGSQWWDSCPDCNYSLVGVIQVCHSPAGHLGGDEFEYYCKKNGADRGSTLG